MLTAILLALSPVAAPACGPNGCGFGGKPALLSPVAPVRQVVALRLGLRDRFAARPKLFGRCR